MLPDDIVKNILEYDGRIKYRKDRYVNIIHKYDDRYNVIRSLVNKKQNVMKNIKICDGLRENSGFYFEFCFDSKYGMGLCYDFNFSYLDKFEICYFDWRNTNSIIQIRSYL
jgi:hypothetical protein